MNLTLSVLIICVIRTTIEACGNGCLMCGTDSACLLCDLLSNYYLQTNACTKATLTNCKILAADGACAQCSLGYYFDATAKVCTAIGTSQVTGCLYYDSTKRCLTCDNSRYLTSSGACTTLTSTVSHCQSYFEDKVCFGCEVGYIFDLQRQSCVQKPSIANCKEFSYLICTACASSYFMNPNLYLANRYTSATVATGFTAQITDEMKGAPKWGYAEVCELKTTGLNCDQYQTASSCKTCALGYYLNASKACVANPTGTLTNCLWFVSTTQCAKCVPGFFLQSQTQCSPIVPIQNCMNYDQKAGTTTCLSCNDGFYIRQNACVSRQIAAIANCQTLSTTSEACDACKTGFQLTSDALACLPSIAKCAAYAPSVSTNSAHYCIQCEDTYYLSSNALANTCVLGTVANCVRYQLYSGVCTACAEDYYLLQGQCFGHTKTDECQTHDPTNPNVCRQCKPGFYPFVIKDTCVEKTTNLITGCILYSADGRFCQQCQGFVDATTAYYYLRYDGQCVAIVAATNCRSRNKFGECIKCAPGLILMPDRTCVAYPTSLPTNCQAALSTGQSLIDGRFLQTCDTCATGTLPYSLKRQHICVDQAYLTTYGLSAPITSCKRYSNTVPSKCLECNSKLLDPSGACVDTCPTDSFLVYDNLDGRRNVCIAFGADPNKAKITANCKLFVRISSFNSFLLASSSINDYRCVKFDVTSPKIVYYDLRENKPFDVFVPFYLHADSIQLRNYYGFVAYSGTAGTPNVDLVTSCDLYYIPVTQTVNPPIKNCLRCAFGKQLTVATGATETTTCPDFITDTCTATKFGGFPSYLNAMLSCHKCFVSAKVLYLFTNIITADFTAYYNANSNTRYKIPFSKYQVPPSGTSPVIKCDDVPANAGAGLIDNCAVYASFLIDAETTQKIICVACKPDYKPTFANYPTTGDPTFTSTAISACTFVANCKTSNANANIIHACTECATNFAFENEKMDSCVACTVANCFIGSGSTCKVCNGGFKYYNNACSAYSVTSPLCSSPQFYDEEQFSVAFDQTVETTDALSQEKVQRYYNSRFSNYYLNGCQSCTGTNFLIMSPLHGITYCLQPSIASPSTTNTDPSIAAITDCSYHQIANLSTGGLQCQTCGTGKILALDYSKCVDLASRTNCLTSFITGTKCNACASGSVNVNGVCGAPTIQKCTKWAADYQPEELCLECEDSYSLDVKGKACTQGTVSNCSQYLRGSTTACKKCKPQHTLILLNNGNYFCYPLQSSMNCNYMQEGSDFGSQTGVLSCRECASTSSKFFFITPFVATPTQAKTVCLKFRASDADNCIAYDQANIPVTRNTFICTACKTGFYLTASNTCAAITTATGCLAYNQSTGICSSCPDGQFYDSANTKCAAYLTDTGAKIEDCSVYASATQCIQCVTGKQLKDGKCTAPTTTIPNCATYSNSGFCNSCATNYLLVSPTQCQLVQAQDCATYLNAYTCATCPSGKGLKRVEDITSCVAMSITNCAVYNGVFPFTCKFCVTDYYLTSNTCTAVEAASKIVDCLYMATATTCAKCKPTSVLSADGKLCTTTGLVLGTNCLSFSMESTSQCVQCQNGFYLVNGVCTPCLQTGNDGCYGCQPGKNICLVCKSGYNMKSDGTCVQNSQR